MMGQNHLFGDNNSNVNDEKSPPPPSAGRPENDIGVKIVGGTEVTDESAFPFYVYWSIGCGASLIAPDVVMSKYKSHHSLISDTHDHSIYNTFHALHKIM